MLELSVLSSKKVILMMSYLGNPEPICAFIKISYPFKTFCSVISVPLSALVQQPTKNTLVGRSREAAIKTIVIRPLLRSKIYC